MEEISIISFLKKPSFQVRDSSHSLKEKIIKVFYVYGLILLSTIIIGIFNKYIDNLLVNTFKLNSILNTNKKNLNETFLLLSKYKFLVVAIFAPLLEELVFRLPLKPKISYIIFPIGYVLYKITGHSILNLNKSISSEYFSLFIYLIFIPSILYLLFLKFKVVELIKKKYTYYFYILAISFSLMHVLNFLPINPKLILLYPLFVLPQFIIGLGLGYIRNIYGLKYSWLLHSLINTPFAILN
jgi:hypothetical protein